MTHHRALDRRQRPPRGGRPARRRHRSRDRPGDRPGRLRRRRGHRGRGRLGQGRVRRLGPHLGERPHPGRLPLPRAAQRAQGRAGRDHHRRARQGALRRPRRGVPRPGGRRVRVRHPAPAQGRQLPAGLDRGRRARACVSRSAWSASSARSTSRRWCRCGSSRSRSRPATPSCSSRARRTRPPRSGWPSCGRRPACPDGVFTVLQGDKVAVDGLLDHPDVASISFVGSTPIAEYVYERASRAGKRVQALGGAKNHMVVLPDADLDLAADAAVSAGYGSAGERCMAISVVVAVGDTGDALVEKIADAHPHPAHRRRRPRVRHGPAGDRACTATRWRRTSTPARPRARRSWSTAARSTSTASRTASGSARRSSTTSPRR